MKDAVNVKTYTGTQRPLSYAHSVLTHQPPIEPRRQTEPYSIDVERECPICTKHTDPETGERRLNAETIAALEEGNAILRGEIPAKRYNSIAEMIADLDADDEDD